MATASHHLSSASVRGCCRCMDAADASKCRAAKCRYHLAFLAANEQHGDVVALEFAENEPGAPVFFTAQLAHARHPSLLHDRLVYAEEFFVPEKQRRRSTGLPSFAAWAATTLARTACEVAPVAVGVLNPASAL